MDNTTDQKFEILATPAPGNPFHLAIPVHNMHEGMQLAMLYIAGESYSQVYICSYLISIYCSSSGTLIKTVDVIDPK